MALGYILAKASSKAVKTSFNIPLVLVLSVIPDADILIRGLQHRGPTHSVIVALIIFIPIFAFYRKKAIPYFLALIQHALIGDYIAGGKIQLFWPLTRQYYGVEMNIQDPINIALEWTFFLGAVIVMLKSSDVAGLLKPHLSNLLLIIPLITLLQPTIRGSPVKVPLTLLPPHLIFSALFLASLAITIFRTLFPERTRQCQT